MVKAYRVGASVFGCILVVLYFCYLYVENRSTRLTMLSYAHDGVPIALLEAAVLVFAYGLFLSASLTIRKDERVWIIPAVIHTAFILGFIGIITHVVSLSFSEPVIYVGNVLILTFFASLFVVALVMVVQTARGLYDVPEVDFSPDESYDDGVNAIFG